MYDPDEAIEVSQVLDLQPRIFSLPVSIILPVMFLSAIFAGVAWLFQASGYMILMTVIVINLIYFFLFGQEYWRLASKFKKNPKWVRSDVSAITFTLKRHETSSARKRGSGARRKKIKRPH